MANKKYLDEDGVQRLWDAINAKFIDTDELTAAGVVAIESMTNAEIDAITGYVPPANNDDNGGG